MIVSQISGITKYFKAFQHGEPGLNCLVTSRRLYSLVPVYLCSLGQINALEGIAFTNMRNVHLLLSGNIICWLEAKKTLAQTKSVQCNTTISFGVYLNPTFLVFACFFKELSCVTTVSAGLSYNHTYSDKSTICPGFFCDITV